MATLPAFYVDNVRLIADTTQYVRGNSVSNISGKDPIGIKCSNNTALRVKNNKVTRIAASAGSSYCYYFSNTADLTAVYNVAARADVGVYCDTVALQEIYNITVHNCFDCIITNTAMLLRNAAFSAAAGSKYWNAYTGVQITGGAAVDIDYLYYYKAANVFVGGVVTEGPVIESKHVLYLDEDSDNFIPDNVSPAINAGTENPLQDQTPDIGGINTKVTDEVFSSPSYWYNLIDNTFWDVTNDYSVEGSLIKAFQSKVFAADEDALAAVVRNAYIKTAESVAKFSENYPMYMRYANASKFAKRVGDMWYSGQNAGTLQAYQNSIGGYNLLPTFIKRMSDYEDGWILGESYIDYDNWLSGYADLQYGIGLDVLGVSTLTSGDFEECYNNVMNSVADAGPSRWFLHDEVQPDNYMVYTDLYNGFEECELDNMFYTDDFTIAIDVVGEDCSLITAPISTLTVQASGTELSLLDRTYCENITRVISYRQGDDPLLMVGAWTALDNGISRIIPISDSYVQFKIELSGIIRRIDYEFIGLALRQYHSDRIWTET